VGDDVEGVGWGCGWEWVRVRVWVKVRVRMCRCGSLMWRVLGEGGWECVGVGAWRVEGVGWGCGWRLGCRWGWGLRVRVRVWLSLGDGVGKDVGEGVGEVWMRLLRRVGVCVMSMLPGLRCVGRKCVGADVGARSVWVYVHCMFGMEWGVYYTRIQ